MLAAYFDDSGTHDKSTVVVWSGLFGTVDQWDSLSQKWAAKLDDPSPSKRSLSRFHMFDCQESIEEFAGWKRTETDFLVHELGQIIIESGVFGYSVAVSRKDWDELITGDARMAMGDLEGMCLRMCYVNLAKLAVDHYAGSLQLACVFDDRPQREAENRKILQTAQRSLFAQNSRLELLSVTFGSSKRIVPLQAADMIAWENYQEAKDLVELGAIRPEFGRKQLQRFDTGRFFGQIALRNSVERIAARAAADPDGTREIARLMQGSSKD